MTPATLETLYQAAMTLPEGDRAALAERLLDSLTTAMPSQLHPAWREEVSRRAAEIDAGEIKPIPWEEVRRLAWEMLDEEGIASDG
jgi:putative addiction module component (TIGR02574 family)